MWTEIYKRWVSRPRTSKNVTISGGNLEHTRDSKKSQNSEQAGSGLMKEMSFKENEWGDSGQTSKPNEWNSLINQL